MDDGVRCLAILLALAACAPLETIPAPGTLIAPLPGDWRVSVTLRRDEPVAFVACRRGMCATLPEPATVGVTLARTWGW